LGRFAASLASRPLGGFDASGQSLHGPAAAGAGGSRANLAAAQLTRNSAGGSQGSWPRSRSRETVRARSALVRAALGVVAVPGRRDGGERAAGDEHRDGRRGEYLLSHSSRHCVHALPPS
jgi:hypothetical protein